MGCGFAISPVVGVMTQDESKKKKKGTLYIFIYIYIEVRNRKKKVTAFELQGTSSLVETTDFRSVRKALRTEWWLRCSYRSN